LEISAWAQWGPTLYGPGSGDAYATGHVSRSVSFCLDETLTTIICSTRIADTTDWLTMSSGEGITVAIILIMCTIFVLVLTGLLFQLRRHYVCGAHPPTLYVGMLVTNGSQNLWTDIK
jgi:hypothetical protein